MTAEGRSWTPPVWSVADLVREFHCHYDLPLRDAPDLGEPGERHLRAALLNEETIEAREALHAGDIVGTAHELADVVYVAYGTALQFGIDLDAVLAEVHRANMSKLDEDGQPILREDGKILKGPNYTPPDVVGVLLYGEADPTDDAR